MHENAKLPPSPAAPRPVPCPECGAKLSAVDFVFRAGTVSNVGSCSGCDKYFDINQDEGRPILVDEYGRSYDVGLRLGLLAPRQLRRGPVLAGP
jgi:hypothetical protein